ncbi:MAG: carbon monoxide dehydrogenase, CoxD accessory protein, partial [Pseudomonadota bacterium]
MADRRLATVVFLALKLGRPLFLEGEPGTGKTEIARTLAAALGRPLIRLQCYEGLDLAGAAYEWNYARQMLEIRLAESAAGGSADDRAALAARLFTDTFLVKRALVAIVRGTGIAPIPGLPPVDWDNVIIATGPLTSAPLAEAVRQLTGEDSLAFHIWAFNTALKAVCLLTLSH